MRAEVFNQEAPEKEPTREEVMAKKKRKICRSKSTGKIVSCKRQRAGRKAAKSKGTRGLGKSKRKGRCLKWSKGRTRCMKRKKS